MNSFTICPLGKLWVNCLKSLKKLSIYLPGKTPSAPSDNGSCTPTKRRRCGVRRRCPSSTGNLAAPWRRLPGRCEPSSAPSSWLSRQVFVRRELNLSSARDQYLVLSRVWLLCVDAVPAMRSVIPPSDPVEVVGRTEHGTRLEYWRRRHVGCWWLRQSG